MRLPHVSLTTVVISYLFTSRLVHALAYDPAYVPWNLNQAQNAQNPLEYAGQWPDHTYFPSPDNWRIPFYTLMLDRWVNGDPTNDNANGTIFEHDLSETQLRHGGDIRGLKDSLDYIQGMGIKVCLVPEWQVNDRLFIVLGQSLSTNLGDLMATPYYSSQMLS